MSVVVGHTKDSVFPVPQRRCKRALGIYMLSVCGVMRERQYGVILERLAEVLASQFPAAPRLLKKAAVLERARETV